MPCDARAPLIRNNFKRILKGYQVFRARYALGDRSIMHSLARQGQRPEVMVVACCDSRVDPALILQCDPGDLFVVRNVANIVPPYEKDEAHHGTSAALEFGICCLKVSHLVILGHSQCGGIQALLNNGSEPSNDFISHWVSLIQPPAGNLPSTSDECAQLALKQSQQHCMTFPWIADRVQQQLLTIHLWYFDIQTGQIFAYAEDQQRYQPLDS
ncbi:carbonic anhydrase [unidentified bacterial endosymbiont]|uniref:carbonic anhydrase n=1 Tax=unidentified bacterial endosymbiont TaxID=2355 RepID=UPI0020A1423D|nr:carbonic anhydrase [unidentified bacterial endosymbiont]